MEFFSAQAPDHLLVGDRELGIEIEVLPLGVVIILEIGDVAGLGPDVLQKQVLAPAGIDHHHVGLEALSGQLLGPVRDAVGAAQARDDGGVAVLIRRVLRTGDGIVGIVLHARDRALLDHPEAHDLVPLGDEAPGQAQELARKILVNESDLHQVPLTLRHALRPNGARCNLITQDLVNRKRSAPPSASAPGFRGRSARSRSRRAGDSSAPP